MIKQVLSSWKINTLDCVDGNPFRIFSSLAICWNFSHITDILATNPMNLTAVVDAVFGIVACASCVFKNRLDLYDCTFKYIFYRY